MRCLSVLFIAGLVWLSASGAVIAQCDEKADSCSTALYPYNSDGKFYRAQLFEGETATVKVTFYEGMMYRVVPCSGQKAQAQLAFSLYDKQGNLLFNSDTDKSDEGFYDFSFGATSDYTIVARFNKGSGCAAVLVGYRRDTGDGGETDDTDLE